MNLNIYYKDTYKRYFNRYLKLIEKKITVSSDPDSVIDKIFTYLLARIKNFSNDRKLKIFFKDLDKEYKIGKPYAAALKALRKKTKASYLDKYSDQEITRLFAEYRTYDTLILVLELEEEDRDKENSNQQTISPEIYAEYVENLKPYIDQLKKARKNVLPKISGQQEQAIDKINNSDVRPIKSSDFTTSRQVLAMHYIFKYIQVNNVDKTDVARFIQFLTGKSFDNIYKRVRDPLRENNKTLKSDLKFIREYFNKLELNEIVKMINNEIAQCDGKI
ncbi:MAG: hypothetical protein ABIJ97_12860 [Bacteroidota bacterium]